MVLPGAAPPLHQNIPRASLCLTLRAFKQRIAVGTRAAPAPRLQILQVNNNLSTADLYFNSFCIKDQLIGAVLCELLSGFLGFLSAAT